MRRALPEARRSRPPASHGNDTDECLRRRDKSNQSTPRSRGRTTRRPKGRRLANRCQPPRMQRPTGAAHRAVVRLLGNGNGSGQRNELAQSVPMTARLGWSRLPHTPDLAMIRRPRAQQIGTRQARDGRRPRSPSRARRPTPHCHVHDGYENGCHAIRNGANTSVTIPAILIATPNWATSSGQGMRSGGTVRATG